MTIRRSEIAQDTFKKLRVLVLIEKYCDSNPACGPTGGDHLWFSAVRASSMVGDMKHFYYDEIVKQHGIKRMHQLLLEECQLFRPDLIIYTPMGGELGEALFSNDILITIRDSLSIPILMVVMDPSPGCRLEINRIPYASYCGIQDSIASYRYFRAVPNVLLMYGAVDPETFFFRAIERDIDVSFVGGVDPQDLRWPMRHEYTSFLVDNGIKIQVSGGQRAQRLDPWQMNDIYNRSKISLNFCRNAGGMVQLKGRIFEITSCGAMMMDSEGTETAEFFEPGKEMIVYSDKQDLLDKVSYYLKYPAERLEIAQAGLEKATEIFNAWNSWGYVFERMGFYLPEWLARDENYRRHRDIMESIAGKDFYLPEWLKSIIMLPGTPQAFQLPWAPQYMKERGIAPIAPTKVIRYQQKGART